MLGAAALGGARASHAQQLPATGLSYTIDVHIEPSTRVIRGVVELRWKNPSQRPADRAILHLYLNAFAHERTTWMTEAPSERVGLDEFLERWADPWGHSEPSAIVQRLEGGKEIAAAWWPIQPDDGNALDRTLIQVQLPQPVAPGAQLELRIEFDGRLPIPIARTGIADDFMLVAQWFPKLGALETIGVRHASESRWAARQFHGPTEFYADFADFDVTIHLPEGWLIGATGERAATAAKAEPGEQVVRYRQRAVHDFAIVAGKNLSEQWTAYQPPRGPPVKVRYLVPRGTEHQIPRWQHAAEGALAVLARRVGPYPYATLTVVAPPYHARRTAGMEYPTLITGMIGDPLLDSWPLAGLRQGEGTVVHEFGHQYFYGLLASNEQVDAFLDEGFNSYWETVITRKLYGERSSSGWLLGRPLTRRAMAAHFLNKQRDTIREPMRRRPASLFYPGSWGLQIYLRSLFTFATAAARFGQKTVDRIFAGYFSRFAFKHPDVEDFLAVVDEVADAEVGAFLREAFSQPRLPDYGVAAATSERWRAPRGWLHTDAGVEQIGAAEREQRPNVGLPAFARETTDQVTLEITDPGWFRGGRSRDGTTRHRRLKVSRRGKPAAKDHERDRFYESVVRIDGPAWDHLPVTVELEFADGVVLRDRWDGKAAWRGYRAVRPAKLRTVRIDPEQQLWLDVDPENDARSLEADSGFAADWGSWLGAVGQWLMGMAGLWL